MSASTSTIDPTQDQDQDQTTTPPAPPRPVPRLPPDLAGPRQSIIRSLSQPAIPLPNQPAAPSQPQQPQVTQTPPVTPPGGWAYSAQDPPVRGPDGSIVPRSSIVYDPWTGRMLGYRPGYRWRGGPQTPLTWPPKLPADTPSAQRPTVLTPQVTPGTPPLPGTPPGPNQDPSTYTPDNWRYLAAKGERQVWPHGPPALPTDRTVRTYDPSGRNNPGNLEIPGQPGRFQSFPTMQAGIEAVQRQLLTYQDRDGLNTLRGIISRYSPPSENDTAMLIRKAEANTGWSADQPLDLHDPATMQRLTRAILLQEQGGTGGKGIPQRLMSPSSRGPSEWGQPPVMDPMVPGSVPGSRDVPNIMAGALPLMAISALAARGPLGLALYAYGLMLRARGNMQTEESAKQAQAWKNQLAIHNDMQSMEGQEVGDAFIEFDQKKDPDDLRAELLSIAAKYQDPQLQRMAEAGNFDGIYKINQRRDMLNQPYMKLQAEIAKQQQQAQAAADTHQLRQLQIEAQRLKAEVAADPNSPDNKLKAARLKEIEAQTQKLQAGKAPKPNPWGPPGSTVAPSGGGTSSEQPPSETSPEEQSPTDPTTGGGDSGDTGDTGDSGAATQAPAGPTQTAQAARPPAQPTTTKAPTAAPSDTQGVQIAGPPETAAQDAAAIARGAGIPAPGPDPLAKFKALPPEAQEAARQFLRNGQEYMRMIPLNERDPVMQGALALQRQIDAIPSNLTGPAVDAAVRKIDPGLANQLGLLTSNTIGMPSQGRMSASGTSGYWYQMAQLARQARPPTATDPGWNADQYAILHTLRDPKGAPQQTLMRVGTLATTGTQVLEDLKAIPERGSAFAGLVQAYQAGTLHDRPDFTNLMTDLYRFTTEAQYLAAGRGLEQEVQTQFQQISPEMFRLMIPPSQWQTRDYVKHDIETGLSRMRSLKSAWVTNHGQGPLQGVDDANGRINMGIINGILAMDSHSGWIPSDKLVPQLNNTVPDGFLNKRDGKRYWYQGHGSRGDPANYGTTKPTPPTANPWQ